MSTRARRGEIAGPPRIGTAGWSVPKPHAEDFPGDGTHLERYSRRLNAVEINSSFYRPHKPATYARWAESVPDGFRFAVKVPKEITHTRRLAAAGELLDRFLADAAGLGAKLGPLLVQLPPSLRYDAAVVGEFFDALRTRHGELVALEPRHASWMTAEAETLLDRFHVARVAADPPRAEADASPGGWPGLIYLRLHGSPRIYYSAYPPEYLRDVGRRLTQAAARGAAAWCIFDNTAAGAATADALTVARALGVAHAI